MKVVVFLAIVAVLVLIMCTSKNEKDANIRTQKYDPAVMHPAAINV